MINTPTFIIIVMTVILFYVWYRVFVWQARLKKEAEEAEDVVDESFLKLKKKIEKQVEMLDGEPGLSEEEKKIRDKLIRALKESERAIKKEVKDIKKNLD